jgi:hypothetical protein
MVLIIGDIDQATPRRLGLWLVGMGLTKDEKMCRVLDAISQRMTSGIITNVPSLIGHSLPMRVAWFQRLGCFHSIIRIQDYRPVCVSPTKKRVLNEFKNMFTRVIESLLFTMRQRS